MIAGTAFGVALNDRRQLEERAADFNQAPYKAQPAGPVLYIKPRNCFSGGGARIELPVQLSKVDAAATIGLLFARDLSRAAEDEVSQAIGAACLALDISESHDDFYRPAIRHRCRDGFLPLGSFAALPAQLGDIVTEIDGVEVHRWSLDRLVRPITTLCAELSQFMTLAAGDLLLVGLPGDPPSVSSGQTLAVRAEGLPSLHTVVTTEVVH